MTMRERLAKAAEEAKKASAKVGEALSDVCDVTKESAKTIAVAVLDQDGDGHITKEDFMLISKRGADAGKKVGKRTVEIMDEASKTELVKEAAAGALVGAAVAVPLPLIGPVAGAVIGASVGVYANVTKGTPAKGRISSRVIKKARAVAKKTISPTKMSTTIKID